MINNDNTELTVDILWQRSWRGKKTISENENHPLTFKDAKYLHRVSVWLLKTVNCQKVVVYALII